MDQKLKCPFCGSELSPAKDSFGNDLYRIFFCKNNRCECFGCKAHAEIWQTLIDGKKAQDILDKIKSYMERVNTAAEDYNPCSEHIIFAIWNYINQVEE